MHCAVRVKSAKYRFNMDHHEKMVATVKEVLKGIYHPFLSIILSLCEFVTAGCMPTSLYSAFTNLLYVMVQILMTRQ